MPLLLDTDAGIDDRKEGKMMLTTLSSIVYVIVCPTTLPLALFPLSNSRTNHQKLKKSAATPRPENEFCLKPAKRLTSLTLTMFFIPC